jgi:2-phosphoglycerate kinase
MHEVTTPAPAWQTGAVSVERGWDVLLIGGASGVGKTHVSYPLARHFGVGITEIDDFHVILERMTTPEQQPALHSFRTDPEAFFALDEEGKLAHAIAYATAMVEPLTYVIANHLDGGAPVVLEGDFLLPSLAVAADYDGIPAAGRVRAFILYEEDEAQIDRNYLAREGEPQGVRVRASWRYSEWLRQEAERLGVPTLAARPWQTVVARALALLLPAGDRGAS